MFVKLNSYFFISYSVFTMEINFKDDSEHGLESQAL